MSSPSCARTVIAVLYAVHRHQGPSRARLGLDRRGRLVSAGTGQCSFLLAHAVFGGPRNSGRSSRTSSIVTSGRRGRGVCVSRSGLGALIAARCRDRVAAGSESALGRSLRSGSIESVRYEPDTTTRLNSTFALNPSTTYHWKAVWGSEFRLVVTEGSAAGVPLYNVGMASPNGVYAPSPHYAYLGAPVGRSGTESASIAGTIYRNVWIANRPRPSTLGSALR